MGSPGPAPSEWNDRHPVGTPVTYRSWPGGQPFRTKTRGRAWRLPSGDAVVMVDGKPGAVALWALEVDHGR